jgi:hypothetical protein
MKGKRSRGIIEAKKFILKDKLGHVRAALEMGVYGPQLRLVEPHKDGGLRLGLGSSGPFIEFFRDSGKWGGHIDAFWKGVDLTWHCDNIGTLVRVHVEPGTDGLSFYDDEKHLLGRIPPIKANRA